MITSLPSVQFSIKRAYRHIYKDAARRPTPTDDTAGL